MENKHTMSDLYQMQSMSLNDKIRMTKYRIKEWVNTYGEDGVYVSFSGGKDSTVLADIVRNVCGYKNIPLVFVDVPTQYPELKQFAMTFDNLVILKPKISFAEVCEKYGFPLISKEISEKAMYSRKYLKKYLEINTITTDRQEIPYAFAIADFIGVDRRNKKNKEIIQEIKMGNIPNELLDKIFGIDSEAPMKARCIFGTVVHKENGVATDEVSKMYDYSKYKFLINAPFDVSNQCCNVMKKQPIHEYAKKTGRFPITAVMASESKLRTQKWLQNGCNGFEMKNPISNPMSFWTEQDVLLYIKENADRMINNSWRIKPKKEDVMKYGNRIVYRTTGGTAPYYTKEYGAICSVYGDVVTDYKSMGQCENQMSFADYGIFDNERPLLKTTGCTRTGCVLCGFGCHLEKEPNRFQMLKETHPKFHNLLYVLKNNGVTYAEAIDWVNEHGNMNIKY